MLEVMVAQPNNYASTLSFLHPRSLPRLYPSSFARFPSPLWYVLSCASTSSPLGQITWKKSHRFQWRQHQELMKVRNHQGFFACLVKWWVAHPYFMAYFGGRNYGRKSPSPSSSCAKNASLKSISCKRMYSHPHHWCNQHFFVVPTMDPFSPYIHDLQDWDRFFQVPICTQIGTPHGVVLSSRLSFCHWQQFKPFGQISSLLFWILHEGS